MTDKPKPKRRWLQFSLRTLFVVVTVFCIWLGIVTKRARDQQQAVEAIQEAGGNVKYNYGVGAAGATERLRWHGGLIEIPLRPPPPPPSLPGPDWLRKLIGIHYFVSVVQVYISPATKAELEKLKSFKELRVLYCGYCAFTDADLEALGDLTNLQVLTLTWGAQITDKGLEHLKGLTNLRQLYLDTTEVTDVGVKKLQRSLPNCEIKRRSYWDATNHNRHE